MLKKPNVDPLNHYICPLCFSIQLTINTKDLLLINNNSEIPLLTDFCIVNLINLNQKLIHANFFTKQNYESGKNILLNKLSHLNGKIEKVWLELSLDSFKVKCKNIFYNLPLNQLTILFIWYQTSSLGSLPRHVTLNI